LLIDILLALGFASSKSEARRLAEGGGVQLVAEGTVADVKKCTVDEVTKETLGQVFESFSAGKPGDAN
jgi:tyrosyl-tRNA synthetase